MSARSRVARLLLGVGLTSATLADLTERARWYGFLPIDGNFAIRELPHALWSSASLGHIVAALAGVVLAVFALFHIRPFLRFARLLVLAIGAAGFAVFLLFLAFAAFDESMRRDLFRQAGLTYGVMLVVAGGLLEALTPKKANLQDAA